jgi:hypothetical protein
LLFNTLTTGASHKKDSKGGLDKNETCHWNQENEKNHRFRPNNCLSFSGKKEP